MCTLERNGTKSEVLQQPAAVTRLQLLTKHDGTSASLAGQVGLQRPGKPAAGQVFLLRGDNLQEQGAAKLHLPHQVRGEEAVGDVGESNILPVLLTFPFSGASAS